MKSKTGFTHLCNKYWMSTQTGKCRTSFGGFRHTANTVATVGSTSGFTFIETIVVLGVMAIALPALFAVLFLVLQQQARVFKTQDVKRQGDTIYNTIKDQIRINAAAVYNDINGAAVCTPIAPAYTSPNGRNLYFQTSDGNWFGFEAVASGMVLKRATALQPVSTALLNSSTVVITAFTISCARGSQFAAPLVSFNFTIASATDPKIKFTYTTSVKLRSI